MLWDMAEPENTTATLELAIMKAISEKIPWLVVASNNGVTVCKALERGGQDLSIVCVTHHAGFREPGIDEMSDEEQHYLSDR